MMNVKDVFERHQRSEKVTSGRVNDSLGLRAMRIVSRRPQSENHKSKLTLPVLPDV
jgi:hypothetical protein